MEQKKRNSEVVPVSSGRNQKPGYCELGGFYFQCTGSKVDDFLLLHFQVIAKSPSLWKEILPCVSSA